MIKHATKMMDEQPFFKEVIDILTEKVLELRDGKEDDLVISGGQRRDWIFSGPVAYNLDLPHLSLYKDGRMEFIEPNLKVFPIKDFFRRTLPGAFRLSENIHISDLITKGSSAHEYVIMDDTRWKEQGWITLVRGTGLKISNLVAVVDRLQDGRERLAEQGVDLYSFVDIGEDFVKKHSENPERAITYMQDTIRWTIDYIRENGALPLIETFNPEAGKLKRAKSFLNLYGHVLERFGKWRKLDKEVNKRYDISLVNLMEDN